jgi:Zn-dependent protease with chaperone function
LYQSVFRQLDTYAKKVDYYHFTPSLADFFIHLIKQVYYVLFLGILMSIFVEFLISGSRIDLTAYLGFSLGISLFLEGILLIIRMRGKIALINTAQEPVNEKIISDLNLKYPESVKISEYRFADIQVPSLFLSAGVTTFGMNSYICLVSRYFNWKLNDKELIAVLLHEVGHVKNNHIKKTYMILGTEVFLRSFRIFIVLIMLLVFYGELEAFKIDLYSFLYLFLIIGVFLASAFMTFFLKYRIYLAEIWADEYSANKVGALELADILRKLPKLIPSPLVYDQSSFLGFRVNLLRDSAKNSLEDIN